MTYLQSHIKRKYISSARGGICIKANPLTELCHFSTVQGNKENIVLSRPYITIPWFKKIAARSVFLVLVTYWWSAPWVLLSVSMYVCVPFSVALAWGKKVTGINNATSLNTKVNLVCVNSARLTDWRARGLLLPTMCRLELCKPLPDCLAVLPQLWPSWGQSSSL